MSQPTCVVRLSSNQSVTSGVDTSLAWDLDEYDPWGMHDPVTNNTRVNIIVAGWYVVAAGVQWEVNATAARVLYLTSTGNNTRNFAYTTMYPTGSINAGQSICTVDFFTTGDYIETIVKQSTGGALNALATNRTTFCAVSRIS